MKKKKIGAFLLCMAVLATTFRGCGASENKQLAKNTKKADNHITVYLWDTSLFDELENYVKEQCPDIEVEFIAGNNNIYLYDYLAQHGELPDIITTRRFSKSDAKNLSPYLLDFGAYDVVSSYYPYVLQYYTGTDGKIQWLPVCGIPETMIVNKTLLDEYGIAIPENYAEFAQACEKLKENGVKPYSSELAADWAAHSLIQGAAIDRFTSLKGIEWRNQAESADGDIAFCDELWMDIFREVNTFIRDTGLDAKDGEMDSDTAKQMFTSREAAIYRGTPYYMTEYQSLMEDELVRLPYFSQMSDESWIYTYPSFNLSMNCSLEENEEKMNAAMKVLNCFLSQEGQEIIAAGQGMISYNVDVESDVSGMVGVESEVKKNAFYIRYASTPSFSASFKAVSGLLTGQMNEQQAMEAFESEINKKTEEEEEIVAEFQNSYSLTVNKKGGRDAASAMLSTIRKECDADLAFTPYYYYSSSIFAGGCTQKEVNMIIKNEDTSTHLTMVEVSGSEVRSLIETYLKDTGSDFRVTNKYELPIASGMKLVLKDTGSGYQLKDIEVAGISLKDDNVYKLLITTDIETVFVKACPNQEALQPLELTLADVWSTVIGEGQQPAEPEDYIELVE